MRKVLLTMMSAMALATTSGVLAQDQPQQTTELQRQLARLGESYKASQSANPQAPGVITAPVTTNQPANPATPDQANAAGPGGVVGATNQPSIAGQVNAQAGRPVVDLGAGQPGQPGQSGQAQPPAQQPVGLSEEAFLATTKSAIPMSPDQVRTLKEMFFSVQRAAAEDPGTPPRPTSTSKTVDLSPGATPPVIRLQNGFVTSIVFLDATGTPWPIQAYDLGDPKAFNIQWDKKTNTNTLMVQAITSYKSGNLAVVLRDLSTPIMVTLLPGQKAVDYRVDLRMPGLGPNAVTSVTSLPSKESPVLLDVLNGVPPQGSNTLKVSGCSSCKAWLYNGHVFFRSRMAVLSPAWVATISSADGMHAYEMQSTPVILVADKGKTSTLTVEGF